MAEEKSSVIDPNDIVIATITLARTPSEEKLLRTSLTRLVSLGMPVLAVDGGSPGTFVSFLKEVRIKVVPIKTRGLVPQVEGSIGSAGKRGNRYILYTEPDKEQFFAGAIVDFIRSIKPSKRMGVALAARDPKAFRTFPSAQRKAESFINEVAAEVFGIAGDYCYGPLLFPSTLSAEIHNLPVDLGWGWRFHLFRRVHELGLEMQHISLPVSCPKEQQVESTKDRIYRYRQLRQNLEGTIG